MSRVDAAERRPEVLYQGRTGGPLLCFHALLLERRIKGVVKMSSAKPIGVCVVAVPVLLALLIIAMSSVSLVLGQACNNVECKTFTAMGEGRKTECVGCSCGCSPPACDPAASVCAY